LRCLAVLTTLAVALTCAPALAETYVGDTVHTTAEFTATHFGLARVKGIIPVKAATVVTAPGKDVPTSVEATLDSTGVDTRNDHRDAELKSDKWLDAAKFPTIDFKSTSVTPAADGTFTINGNLTIHGTTKPVALLAHLEGKGKDARGNDRIAYTAEVKFDRRDFGIASQAGNAAALVVGNQIAISIEFEGDAKK
jgi:polyisoprenoid-binding protein YceI